MVIGGSSKNILEEIFQKESMMRISSHGENIAIIVIVIMLVTEKTIMVSVRTFPRGE